MVLHAHYFRSRHATAWRNCLHKFSNLTVNSLLCHHFCYQNWIHTFDIATFLFYDVTCLLVNMAAVTMILSASSFSLGKQFIICNKFSPGNIWFPRSFSFVETSMFSLTLYCKFQTLNISLPLIQIIYKEYQNFLALCYLLWWHNCSFNLY